MESIKNAAGALLGQTPRDQQTSGHEPRNGGPTGTGGMEPYDAGNNEENPDTVAETVATTSNVNRPANETVGMMAQGVTPATISIPMPNSSTTTHSTNTVPPHVEATTTQIASNHKPHHQQHHHQHNPSAQAQPGSTPSIPAPTSRPSA